MDDFSDFQYEDDADDVEEGQEEPQEGGNNNRTFLIVAGILGAVLVLAVVCMVVYAMVFLPQRRDAQSTQAAEINMQNTSVAMAAGMTAQAQAWTLTPTVTNTLAPNTATPTRTPVLAPTDTPLTSGGGPTQDPRTATVSALLTQQAGGLTATPTSTQLPNTGFADDVGIPGMIALAGALVVVIFLARRLRSVNS
ncbi:MAG TPA: hypothetical protein DEH25_18635 [Chloroflexi bacterium]|nr:hypothetical protein [Chloroflexota bacterium]